MDGNSIITQVVASNSVTIDNYDSNTEVTNPFRSTLITQNRKKKRKGFIKTLFCCFSAKQEENKLSFENNNCITTIDKYLLPQIKTNDIGKKCLIIDLDETLVHSSFKPVSNADFIVPVEIEGTIHQVYVLKRPYVDNFLQRMGEIFECVLFTASLAKYADPVADLLDKWNVFRCRLFREACVYYRGNYVKDLSKLGRDLNQVLICDNSPASYIFHPDNAVPVSSWFDDPNDTELMELIPFMERIAKSNDIYTLLKQGNLNELEKNSSLNNINLFYNQSKPIQTDQSKLDYHENKDTTSINNIDNNNDYLLQEASIVVSMDIVKSINTIRSLNE